MVAPRKKEIVNSFRNKGGIRRPKGSSKHKTKVKYLKYEIIRGLCDTMTESPLLEDRRSAAVVLTVRCLKKEIWQKIREKTKEKFKKRILEGYFAETDKGVQGAIAGVIAAVAKQDFANGKWNNLMSSIITAINSDNCNTREISLKLFNKVAESISKAALSQYYIDLLHAFQGAITDRSNDESSYIILRTLRHICKNIGPQEMDYFKPLVPSILLSAKVFIASNDDLKIYLCLEICMKLLDRGIEIKPHIETIFDICVKIFTQTKYHYKIRAKAMNVFSGLLTRNKQETNELFKKKVLYQFVLHILFPMIDNGALKEIKKKNMASSEKSLKEAAVEVVQSMIALDDVVTLYVLRHVEPDLNSQSAFRRRLGSSFIKLLSKKSALFLKNKEGSIAHSLATFIDAFFRFFGGL